MRPVVTVRMYTPQFTVMRRPHRRYSLRCFLSRRMSRTTRPFFFRRMTARQNTQENTMRCAST